MRASALFCLALAIVLPLVGCYRAQRHVEPPDPMARAREIAVDYLASLYSPDHLFADPYVTCEDEGPPCDPAFRELDHAVLVEFWLPERLRGDPRLSKIVEHSRRLLDRWLARWRDRPLDLTAVDLYALFPYYYPGEPTRHMLGEVVRGMSDDGDWEAYDAHALAYRKVTDELWTVLALVRNHVDAKVKVAIARKRQEAARILDGDFRRWPMAQKFYGLSHVALLFLITAQAGYDVSDSLPLLDEVERWLASAIDAPAVARSTATVAEDLEILSLAGYPDRARLSRMAQILVSSQEPSGRWRAEASRAEPERARPAGFAAAHTTLLALAALEAWSNYGSHAAERMQRRWIMLSGPNPITALAAGPSPSVDYATVEGRRVAVGFPVASSREIQFINEARANWENSVLFFPASGIRADLDRLANDPSERAAAERNRQRALLEIVEQAAAFRPSRQGIRADRSHGVVKFDVSLELEGPGASESFAARAADAIERAWKGSAAGGAVVTRATVRVRSASSAPSEGALPVFVSADGGSPYTKREGDAGSMATTWPSRLSNSEIAHEMGHLFGFADEYHIEERSGFYYVVYDDPGRIMSCPAGQVTAADLDQLVAAYVISMSK